MRIEALALFVVLALKYFDLSLNSFFVVAKEVSQVKFDSEILNDEVCYFVMRKVIEVRKEDVEGFVAKGVSLGIADGRSIWRKVTGVVFEECLGMIGEFKEQVKDVDEFKDRAMKDLLKLHIFDFERLNKLEENSLRLMSQVEDILSKKQNSIRFNAYRASRAYKHESNDKAFI